MDRKTKVPRARLRTSVFWGQKETTTAIFSSKESILANPICAKFLQQSLARQLNWKNVQAKHAPHAEACCFLPEKELACSAVAKAMRKITHNVHFPNSEISVHTTSETNEQEKHPSFLASTRFLFEKDKQLALDVKGTTVVGAQDSCILEAGLCTVIPSDESTECWQVPYQFIFYGTGDVQLQFLQCILLKTKTTECGCAYTIDGSKEIDNLIKSKIATFRSQ